MDDAGDQFRSRGQRHCDDPILVQDQVRSRQHSVGRRNETGTDALDLAVLSQDDDLHNAASRPPNVLYGVGRGTFGFGWTSLRLFRTLIRCDGDSRRSFCCLLWLFLGLGVSLLDCGRSCIARRLGWVRLRLCVVLRRNSLGASRGQGSK